MMGRNRILYLSFRFGLRKSYLLTISSSALSRLFFLIAPIVWHSLAMAYNMHYVMEKWLVQSLDTITSDARLTWLVLKTYYAVSPMDTRGCACERSLELC